VSNPLATIYALACVLALGARGNAASPSPIASPSQAAVREISAFASVWEGITGYTATVAIFDEKGAQTQNLLMDYTFRKPNNVTVHVIAGPNAGVTLTWDGGSSVVAHRGSGLAAMFKRTLSLHDPQVTTLRGSSIDQLSFEAIVEHGQQSAGALSESAGETIGGLSTNAVTLTPASPADDNGLTREVVEFSSATHLPIRALAYEGSTLVRKVDFSNIKLQTASM
jgi:outer membrane lipoprotein-sorting protein